MKVDTIAKQLLFSTCKLTNFSGDDISFGTGFFFNASSDPSVTIPMIVTNKHVVAGADRIGIDFIEGDGKNDEVNLGRRFRAELLVSESQEPVWVGHPDPAVDIAVIPIGEVLNSRDTPPLFFIYLTSESFPSAKAEAGLDAIEELTFIGYPNGWADEVHHTPIVRRAISATPISLPFSGRPTFLMDGSVFGGSSGSPVFIVNNGMYIDNEGLTLGQIRLLLVGIVAQTLVRHQALPLQVLTQPHTQLAQEMNLGVAFSWRSIEETVDMACAVAGINRHVPTSWRDLELVERIDPIAAEEADE